MWSKFTSAIRPRIDTSTIDAGNEQHTNQQTEVPFPSPGSPPASPTRNNHTNTWKRLSRNPYNNENKDTFSKNSLGKKMMSSFISTAPGSEGSLRRASGESAVRRSQDSPRPSVDSAKLPATPADTKPPTESRFGSLRSILKPNNTPGTGQSVRFFSRDAYRVISPEQSSASEFEDPSLLDRLQRSTSARPSVKQVFSTPAPSPSSQDDAPSPAVTSMIQPLPPPEIGNIFNLSSEEPPTIPVGATTSLLDSAFEVSEADSRSERSVSLDTIEEKPGNEEAGQDQDSLSASPTIKLPPAPAHDRSHSFSFGQTLFHSLGVEPPLAGGPPQPQGQSPAARHRALSDTVFMSMINTPGTLIIDSKRPESRMNNTPNTGMPSQGPERDPFAANATTYYTPGTMLPPSPPPSHHTRTASREEDMIWSLRTQLTLQTELCAQYEVDLAARDELVETLTVRLSQSEKEGERRRGVIRTWRKRVLDLEKCIRVLEEEVEHSREEIERSREENADRSIMDEASGEALRVLQSRISELEREKGEVGSQVEELEGLREELRRRDLVEEELRNEIKVAKDEVEHLGRRTPRELTDAGDKPADHAEILAVNEDLRTQHATVQAELVRLREDVINREEEMAVLQAELEAQWKHAERHTEEMERMKKEKKEMAAEADALRQRVSGDWDESENRQEELEAELQEAWSFKNELQRERDELEQQLRDEQEHATELTQALQEREDRVAHLERERQFAVDSAKRVQENLRQRDADIAGYMQRIREGEAALEDAREGLTRQKREHSRIVDEQSRRIAEVVAREVESRAGFEQVLREKVQAEVQMSVLTERVASLTQEVERLRRQVQELQQESASKDLKLVQLGKQAARHKDDFEQVNLALEAKQQELELVKRHTAVGTNVKASTAPRAATFRRESSIFGTPSVVAGSTTTSRPPSSMSDASSTATRKERRVSVVGASRPPSSISDAKERRISDSSAAPPRLSVRPNGAINVSQAARRGAEASVPPSALRTRLSPTSAVPTRPSSMLSRAPVTNPAALKAQRRPSVSLESMRNKPVTASEHEKENLDVDTTPVARRMSALVSS